MNRGDLSVNNKGSKKQLRPPSQVMPKRTAFQIVTKVSNNGRLSPTLG
jgi:hypothetical protein